MTALLGAVVPYAGPDHKLHCPYDRGVLSVDGYAWWQCATGAHRWHRFGNAGAWRLMRGAREVTS